MREIILNKYKETADKIKEMLGFDCWDFYDETTLDNWLSLVEKSKTYEEYIKSIDYDCLAQEEIMFGDGEDTGFDFITMDIVFENGKFDRFEINKNVIKHYLIRRYIIEKYTSEEKITFNFNEPDGSQVVLQYTPEEFYDLGFTNEDIDINYKE